MTHHTENDAVAEFPVANALARHRQRVGQKVSGHAVRGRVSRVRTRRHGAGIRVCGQRAARTRIGRQGSPVHRALRAQSSRWSASACARAMT